MEITEYFYEIRKILHIKLNILKGEKLIIPSWTRKELEIVKEDVIKDVARKIWLKKGCPKNVDMEIWLEAEKAFYNSIYLW